MDKASWAKIFTTDILYKAEIAKSILEEVNIKSVIVDKKDSAYGIFGEIELYVQRENVIRAKHTFSKKNMFNE